MRHSKTEQINTQKGDKYEGDASGNPNSKVDSLFHKFDNVSVNIVALSA